MAKKERSDADRRVRQCERLGRLLRLLHLIMGKGRWDAGTLAEELGCSRRTVYRLLQTLSLAGVPWYLDETARCYRIRPGFKFPGLGQTAQANHETPTAAAELEPAVRKLISEMDAFAASLHGLLETLQKQSGNR
jgi:predicted DNA-binding transcriptional regulator YafY